LKVRKRSPATMGARTDLHAADLIECPPLFAGVTTAFMHAPKAR
jgi:hypothetical protein